MKEYDLCIRDITRAFDHSYPNNLMYKLFERKARCLKALKDFPRALEAMKSAEMWMKYSTLSETKSSSFKKDITKQVRRNFFTSFTWLKSETCLLRSRFSKRKCLR